MACAFLACTTNRLREDKMALPIASETERTVHLRKIVQATENTIDCRLTDDDLLLFARIIHMYSSIDFVLRMAVEIMDDAGMLAPEWKGKTTKLNMYKLNQAIRSACARRGALGLPFPAHRSSAAPPRFLPRLPDRGSNRTFFLGGSQPPSDEMPPESLHVLRSVSSAPACR
jgi:hypothetical protein